MAILKKPKTFTTPSVITYEVSYYRPSCSTMTDHTRTLSDAQRLATILRQNGFDVISVNRHIEEVEPDIFLPEICQLTGLKRSTIYQYKDRMPIRTKGNKLTAKRSEIIAWQNNR